MVNGCERNSIEKVTKSMSLCESTVWMFLLDSSTYVAFIER